MVVRLPILFWPKIRIGPAHNHYVYDLRFGSGVYCCERCSQWCDDAHLAVFRTQENAVSPGWHKWQTNYQADNKRLGADWRDTGLRCETTELVDAVISPVL